MPSLKCTRKLLREMGIQPATVAEIGKPSLLGDWHVNLLRVSRRKVLLFTNEDALYSFVVLGVRKADLDRIAEVFVTNLRQNLTYEGIPTDLIDRIALEYREAAIAQTDNRSVLGSMNDLAWHLKHYVYDAGGIESCDVWAINGKLNQIPQRPLGWKFSAEVIHECLLGAAPIPLPPIRHLSLN